MEPFVSWHNLDCDVETIVKAFRACTTSQKLKLESHLWRSSASVWGSVSKRVFGRNEKVFRWHLFLIWHENRKKIKVLSKLPNNDMMMKTAATTACSQL